MFISFPGSTTVRSIQNTRDSPLAFTRSFYGILASVRTSNQVFSVAIPKLTTDFENFSYVFAQRARFEKCPVWGQIYIKFWVCLPKFQFLTL